MTGYVPAMSRRSFVQDCFYGLIFSEIASFVAMLSCPSLTPAFPVLCTFYTEVDEIFMGHIVMGCRQAKLLEIYPMCAFNSKCWEFQGKHNFLKICSISVKEQKIYVKIFWLLITMTRTRCSMRNNLNLTLTCNIRERKNFTNLWENNLKCCSKLYVGAKFFIPSTKER